MANKPKNQPPVLTEPKVNQKKMSPDKNENDTVVKEEGKFTNRKFSGRGRGRAGGIGGGPSKFRPNFNTNFIPNFGSPNQLDLPKEKEEKKATGRCRLFIGNLTNDMEEDEFRQMFEKFGTVYELFLNKSRGFGFVRLDTRANAEAAKSALDGTQRKGKVIRVRFAAHSAALRVRNIHQCISNELLEQAFGIFGPVERAIVIVDERGRHCGEGIIEFAQKRSAMMALNRCTEGVFLVTASPKALIVEPLEQKDEEDGLPEKVMPKNVVFSKERDAEARFAQPGSFEFEFGNRWKKLFELEKQQRENLEKDIIEAREKLEAEMENAALEHQTILLRQDLMRRQEELRRIEEARNQRIEMRRQEDEQIRDGRRNLLMGQDMMARQGGGGGGSGLMNRRQDNMMMQNQMQNPGGMVGMPNQNLSGSGLGGNLPVGTNMASGSGGAMTGGGLLPNQGNQTAANLGMNDFKMQPPNAGGGIVSNNQPGGLGGNNQGMMGQNMMGSSRFEQGNSAGGAMGGNMVPNISGLGRGNPGNMMTGGNMGGGMGNMRGMGDRPNMMDRRRDMGGRENYGDTKRRRF